jgi:hypothetical protein
MVPDRSLDPYYAEFVPIRKAQEVRPHVHPGYEFLYLLEGDLEIRHADKTHVMEAGDSVYFDASTPHAYRCAGKVSAVAIIVTMHQAQAPVPAVSLRPLGAALGRTGGATQGQGQAPSQNQTADNQTPGSPTPSNGASLRPSLRQDGSSSRLS